MTVPATSASADQRPRASGGTTRTAPAMPAIEWIQRVADLEPLVEEWEALEVAAQDRTVFSTFDFLSTLYHNYAGEYGGQPLIGVARRGHKLVGVAPFVVRRGRVGGIPVTRVQFAMHEAHAGEFLVENDDPETIAAFLDALPRAVKFDVTCLNGIEPGSARFRALEDVAKRQRLAVELTIHPNAVVDLRNGYDGYCRAMSRNFRRTVKRQAQRVTSAGHPVVEGVQLTSGIDHVESCIARLFAVNEASYKLKGQRLADIHRDFLAGLAGRFGPRGMLHLSILSIGGRDAAAVMGVVERGCYYDVTLAYVEEFAELSPGAYLMQEVLRDLAAAGVHTVVSHGAHEYKGRWTTAFVPSTRVFLFPAGAKAAATRFIRFGLAPLWRRLGVPDP